MLRQQRTHVITVRPQVAAGAAHVGRRSGGIQEYRVALVVKPHEAKARRLARHPRIVDLAKIAEKVAEIPCLCLWRQVSDKNLHRHAYNTLSRVPTRGRELTVAEEPVDTHTESKHCAALPLEGKSKLKMRSFPAVAPARGLSLAFVPLCESPMPTLFLESERLVV